jgi:hypothetical protein
MMQQQLGQLYKFGRTSPEEGPWLPGKVFARDTRGSTHCLRIAATDHQVQLLDTLIGKMPAPFWLLYVLVVPRGEGQPGRYQSSDPLTNELLKEFLARFRNFLESDGRYNIWIKSESGPALLVWDRHDLIYAYGFEEEWAKDLLIAGWTEVDADVISLPDPHAHHYHEIFDEDSRAILAAMKWNHSPLREQDN